MRAMRIVIDPRFEKVVPENGYYLFKPGSEYRLGILEMTSNGSVRLLPAETMCHVYAYEVLERIMELERRIGAGEVPLVMIPLWPEALFLAIGERANASGEMENRYPQIESVEVRKRGPGVVSFAVEKLVPGTGMDPVVYTEALVKIAGKRGWTLREPEDEED